MYAACRACACSGPRFLRSSVFHAEARNPIVWSSVYGAVITALIWLFSRDIPSAVFVGVLLRTGAIAHVARSMATRAVTAVGL